MQFSITGTDTLQGTFVEKAKPSPMHCAPLQTVGDTVDGKLVYLDFAMAPPPTGQPIPVKPGFLVLLVGNHAWAPYTTLLAPMTATGTIQINFDGSGSVTFQNLALETDRSTQPMESGSFTWNCV